MNILATLILSAAAASFLMFPATATPAYACAAADPYSGRCVNPGRYQVIATDGTLAVQRTPDTGNVDHSIGGNGTPVWVVCQVNDGGVDSYDGLTSRTWDYITEGGWVYNHFVSTPAPGPDGWSPGVRHCDSPAGASVTPAGAPLATAAVSLTTAGASLPPAGDSLTPAIAVPDQAPRAIETLGPTAGPLFHDGPGFTNARVAQTLADAERIGVCQSLVLANTDYWWLLPDDVANNVFTWADLSRQHGRQILDHPVVGAAVVFKGGWHDGWNYGTGHVAMVMRTYGDGSFTVAEFNWHAKGGGTQILDLRRVSRQDDAPTAFIR